MECISKKYIYVNSHDSDDTQVKVQVPCGKCIACLQSKRHEWIYRLTQEHKHSKGSVFITLTYNNKYCPEKLSKPDVQKFLKRLRKRTKLKFRYYLVGEYGTKFKRPHYHILLFNSDGITRTDLDLSWSKYIRKKRKYESMGIIDIGTVTEASIAYCTKYVIQGQKTGFTQMSRNNGIGFRYLSEQMINWHRAGNRNYVLDYDKPRKLPRFYKDKIFPKKFAITELNEKLLLPNPQWKRIASLARWKHIKKKLQYEMLLNKKGVRNPKLYMLKQNIDEQKRVLKSLKYTQKL